MILITITTVTATTIADQDHIVQSQAETIELTNEQWDAVTRQRTGFSPAEWAKACIEIDLEDCVGTMLEGGDQAREELPRAD